MNNGAIKQRRRTGIPGMFIPASLAGILLMLLTTSFLPVDRIALAQEQDFDKLLETGRDLLRRNRFDEALKSFKRANEMREKKSPEALLAIAQTYLGLEAFKSVIEACDRVIELTTDGKFRSSAYNFKGIALLSQAKNTDQKKLQEAEAAFRQASSESADMSVSIYNLGVAILQQGRDAEGIVFLKKYLETQPGSANADAARKFIANPRRAREAFAPDFSVTTSEGEHITLEDLRGKVVLLDFWATWCRPCVDSVPSLRDLRKRYENDAFVMIGVSSDSEENKWLAFTTKNKMVWPQYLDRNRQIQRAFEIRAFPTYIVIDHEGIIRFRSVGSGFVKAADLNDAIRKQIKIVTKSVATN